MKRLSIKMKKWWLGWFVNIYLQADFMKKKE